MAKAIYKGADGSMGLKHGETYKVWFVMNTTENAVMLMIAELFKSRAIGKGYDTFEQLFNDWIFTDTENNCTNCKQKLPTYEKA